MILFDILCKFHSTEDSGLESVKHFVCRMEKYFATGRNRPKTSLSCDYVARTFYDKRSQLYFQLRCLCWNCLLKIVLILAISRPPQHLCSCGKKNIVINILRKENAKEPHTARHFNFSVTYKRSVELQIEIKLICHRSFGSQTT